MFQLFFKFKKKIVKIQAFDCASFRPTTYKYYANEKQAKQQQATQN